MASDQLWGGLVKAMTRKIEMPKLGGETIRTSPVASSSEQAERDGTRIPGGRRTEDPPDAVATGPAVATREEAINRIAAQLGYVAPKIVDEYLVHHGGENGVVSRRMAALGLVPSSATGGGSSFWWQALSQSWIDTELMAEILRSAPGMPQSRPVSGLLFDFLLDAEVGSYREVKAANEKALNEGRRLLEVLVSDGTLTEARAADLGAEFFGLRRRRGKRWETDPDGVGTISVELSEAFDAVPMKGGDDDATTLLVIDDPGPILLETLKRVTGREVRLLIDTPSKFHELQDAWRTAAEQARNKARRRSRKRSVDGSKANKAKFRLDQDSFAGISYVPEMVQAILERATNIAATDIHLEPYRERLRVRFRVDGILYDVAQLARAMGDDVISRIKVMADMDITERRRPQDGHVHQELLGEPYDFRIATVPTSNGERMAIRITAASKDVPEIASLGLDEHEESLILDFTKRSHGIILACGPVGSGKTTTLYASLGQIDSAQKNIMTIEDPVEIELPNVSQVPVNAKIGVSFSQGLRSLLRHDPNIILVGEVRDEETAKVAVRASLTGLLVFSTIHANSAPGAVTTLYNFHIPPFLLATSLVGVIAQRLVRTICPDCKTVHEPEESLLRQSGFLTDEAPPAEGKAKTSKKKKPAMPTFYKGTGCDNCYGTGYAGRVGIFEILDVNEKMRQAITERAPEAQLREMAVGTGMRTLVSRGRALVEAGDTTIDEFIRVLYQ